MKVKRQIRRCIFESNSSTTHTCVLMTKENYNKWKSSYYYCYYEENYGLSYLPEEKKPRLNNIYTLEEAINFIKLDKYFDEETEKIPYEDEDELENFLSDCGFISYDKYFYDDYLESDENWITTPNGENIVAVCKYGHDG